jgi:hypothetical protein
MSELKVITLVRQLLDAMSYINRESKSENIQKNCTETSSLITSSWIKTNNSKSLILDWLEMSRFR